MSADGPRRSESPSANPLVGDPRREAWATSRGFAFQDLYAAYRWATLSPTETLVLEGAEDADVLDAALRTGETVQVKDAPGRGALTLASRVVQDSLSHLFTHRSLNPEYTLGLRLVATAPRGAERGRPFGEAGGLTAWEACARGEGDPERLRDYLLGLPHLSEGLKAWVRACTPATFVDGLVFRVQWETGQDRADLRHRFEEAVVRRASVLGVWPEHARALVPELLDTVRRLGCEPLAAARRLSLADLEDRLRQATTVRVDRRLYGIFQQLALGNVARAVDAGALADPRAAASARALMEAAAPAGDGEEQPLLLAVADLIEAFDRVAGGTTGGAEPSPSPGMAKPARPLLLALEDRRALGLMATAIIPFNMDQLTRVFPDEPWRRRLHALRRAGYVEAHGGKPLVAAEARRTILRSAEEVASLHRAWVAALDPRRMHPDIGMILMHHHLALGDREAALEALCDGADGIEPGPTNERYLGFFRKIVEGTARERLSPPLRARLYNVYGLCLSRAGHYDEAVAWHVRLRRYAVKHANVEALGLALINEGVTHYERDELDLAERRYREAVAHAEAHGDADLLGRALHNVGMTLAQRRDPEAEAYLQRALEVKRANADEESIAAAHLGLGYYSSRVGDHPRALAEYRRAAVIARRADLPYQLALALTNMASAQVDLKRPERAYGPYAEARRVSEAGGFAYPLRLAVQGEAVARTQGGDYEEAERLFRRLHEIELKQGNGEGAARALHDAAVCLLKRGMLEEALRTLRRALAAARKAGSERWVYRCRLARALASSGGEGTADAAPELKRLARAEQTAGWGGVAARLLQARAEILSGEDGSDEEAERAFAEAAAQHEVAGTGAEEAIRFQTNRYLRLVQRGRLAAALDVLDGVIAAAERHGREDELMRALDEKATGLQRLDRYDEAAGLHERALALARRLGDDVAAATSLVNTAELYRKTGRVAEALPLYEEAERLAQATSDHGMALLVAHNRALALQGLRRYDEAEALLRRTRDEARRLGHGHDVATAWHALGNLARARKRNAEALRFYRRSMSEALERELPENALDTALSYAYALLSGDRVDEARALLAPFEEGAHGVFRGRRAYALHWALAELGEAAGDERSAVTHWRQAARAAEAYGDIEGAAGCRAALLRAHQRVGNVVAAREAYTDALARETDPEFRLIFMHDRARNLFEAGADEEGEAVLAEALERVEGMDAPALRSDLYVLKGDRLWAKGNPSEGTQAFAIAIAYGLVASASDLIDEEPDDATTSGNELGDDDGGDALPPFIRVGLRLFEQALQFEHDERVARVDSLYDATVRWLRGGGIEGMDADLGTRVLLWPLRAVRRLSSKCPTLKGISSLQIDAVLIDEVQGAIATPSSSAASPIPGHKRRRRVNRRSG